MYKAISIIIKGISTAFRCLLYISTFRTSIHQPVQYKAVDNCLTKSLQTENQSKILNTSLLRTVMFIPCLATRRDC